MVCVFILLTSVMDTMTVETGKMKKIAHVSPLGRARNIKLQNLGAAAGGRPQTVQSPENPWLKSTKGQGQAADHPGGGRLADYWEEGPP